MTLYDQTTVTELEHTFTIQTSFTRENRHKRGYPQSFLKPH